jgi:hypothetical protein
MGAGHHFLVRPFCCAKGHFGSAIGVASSLSIGGGVVRLGGVNLDPASKLGTVLNANARGGDVADYGAIAFYVNAIACVKIADYFSKHDNLAGMNLRSELGGRADGELVAAQGNWAIHLSINLQIFGTGDMTFDLQPGTEARRSASGTAAEHWCRDSSRGAAESDYRGFRCLGRR